MQIDNPGSTGFMAAFGWVFGGLAAVAVIGAVVVGFCMLLCGGCLFLGSAVRPTPEQMEQYRRDAEIQEKLDRLQEERMQQIRDRAMQQP